MRVPVLGFAILGLLAKESLSGYDLTLRMGDPVGFFWQARHSQIYPELAKLEGEGMVTHAVIAQDGRPDKKVYEITSKGLEVVKGWVADPAKTGPTRDEATLKAYLSWLADPDDVAERFRELAGVHEARLSRYRQMEDWMRREWGEDLEGLEPRKFAGYAALRRGIGYEREYAEWCRWVAGSLEKRV